MKILLLGANGQVGFELARALADTGDLVPATRGGDAIEGKPGVRVDLADAAALAAALDRVAPDLVVNAAAYTAVDRAEDEPALADRVNHRAVAEIARWAAAHDARMLHYSTDYVFDGRATRPYREEDVTHPLGVYGASKLAGEDAIRASGARHLIVRTAWVYAPRGTNFLRTMLRLGGERDEIRVVADQIGAPTPASAIADASGAMIARWSRDDEAALDGTYHVVAGGSCSWHAFAVAILEGAARRDLMPRAPRVVPIATADYPTRAKRPAWSVLDAGRLESAFGLQLPDWRSGLDAVLDAIARG